MGKDYDNAAAVRVRSFVLRYMEAHGAETHGVRAELDQLQAILGHAAARLTSSFEAICAYSASHAERTVSERFDGANAIHADAPGAIGVNRHRPAALAAGIEDSLNEAVTALQFYDIASQILAHAGRRIEFLEQMAGQLAQLPDTTVEELDHVLKSACAARGHNPAGQALMTVGATEFF